METNDLLLVGTEVSVALAGFAGIVATFQFRDDESIKRGDVVALTMIVQLSLGCALLTIIPILLSIIGFDEERLWVVCSLIGAAWGAYHMYIVDRGMRGAVRRTSLRILFGGFQGVFGIIVASLLLNTVDIFFHKGPGPYLIGIVLCLSLVGYMFTRLLVHPLWQTIGMRERAEAGTAEMSGRPGVS